MLTACEKYDFSDAGQTESDEAWQRPTDTGQGTSTAPYTVEDILWYDHEGEDECWVIGYVVGATYRTMENIELTNETSYTRNILLASDTIGLTPWDVLPVELSTTALQKQFSLPYRPEGFHQCVMLQGRPLTYFNTNGLREIRTGHWLFGFNIRSIHPTPQEWTEVVISSPER